MVNHRGILLVTMAVATLALPSAMEARELSQNEALALVREGKIKSLETLLGTALQRYPQARLLEAELEHSKKRKRYRYEFELLLPDGSVRELEFDAVSGNLLYDKEDD